MKKTIEKYTYVKTIDSSVEIDLPDNIEYHFETGIRRSICIIPVWTTWQKEQGKEEEIWKYDIICVYGNFEDKIEKTSIAVSDLSDILKTTTKYGCLNDFLVNGRSKYTVRTKEQFMADYNNVLNKINNLL